MKIQKKHILFTLYVFVCFYGVNWLSHHFLPKWWDILTVFPLSVYLLYRGGLFYVNRFG